MHTNDKLWRAMTSKRSLLLASINMVWSAIEAMECVDRGQATICAAHEEEGNCKRPEFEPQMKLLCRKTCELCA
ncbi:shTK domain protein [Cooperia oncophora]